MASLAYCYHIALMEVSRLGTYMLLFLQIVPMQV